MNKKAADYLRDNFQPDDRLAIVLLNKRRGDVVQRLAPAERAVSEDFQVWLGQKNAAGYDVYVSMNALHDEARGRTKADIGVVRHVYLDFDHDGTAAVQKLLARDDVPKPNYLLQTSPGKWQAVWKVDGFSKDHAEHLQRGLAREAGADPAATDCSRVLRVPGFRNHKYAGSPMVRVQTLSNEMHGPDQFPKFPEQSSRELVSRSEGAGSPRPKGTLTQSERYWAYAKRALSRGDPEELVTAAIANYRRHDKHDPQAYAERTVRKAVGAVKVEASPMEDLKAEPAR